MYTRALATEHAAAGDLVALADPNPVRIAAHQRLLDQLGASPAAGYQADAFATMLATERVDTVIVTTMDSTHDRYIVAALEAGCDVITEKPMTVDAPRCRRILEAVARTGRRVTVTFNYRYNPIHEKVRELLAGGAIGEIGSVHFEWLLDVRHGADYFRRWHREKANSGGLLVHKASHHFDLVNWWLATMPEQVYAVGQLFFYGENGARRGYDRGYDRVHGSSAAADDPFALRLADDPVLTELYLDAEHIDGYFRDRNVFAPGVTIEDDLAVLVRYRTGVTMSYHLTAYAPWEGYRVMFNGSKGRLELEVVESDHVSAPAAGFVKGTPGTSASESGGYTLAVRPYWRPPYRVEVSGYSRAGHGGADTRMTAALFNPRPDKAAGAADPLGRAATERDGAASLLVGLAGNASLATGAPVRVADLVDLDTAGQPTSGPPAASRSTDSPSHRTAKELDVPAR
jgi:predicted dehydrogenase